MGRVGQRGGRTGAVPLWQQLLAMPGRCPRPPLGASTSPLPRLVWPPGLDPFLKAPGPVFFPLFSVSLPPAAGQALGSPPPRCPSLPTSLAWPRGISLEHPHPRQAGQHILASAYTGAWPAPTHSGSMPPRASLCCKEPPAPPQGGQSLLWSSQGLCAAPEGPRDRVSGQWPGRLGFVGALQEATPSSRQSPELTLPATHSPAG